MPQAQMSQVSGVSPKVLFAASESAFQELVSAFLAMMGCQCSVVTTVGELERVARANFDAALIEGETAWADQAISTLHPVFAQNIVLVGGQVADTRISDLARRYELWHFPHELWPKLLWPGLQRILWESIESSRPDLQVPDLTFDSFCLPVVSGVRSQQPKGRQLAYRYQGTAIDVLIEPGGDGSTVLLTGQVLDDRNSRGDDNGMVVVVAERAKTIARTVTNSHGEFTLNLKLRDELTLEIRLRKGVWVSIPVGKMGWIRTRTATSFSDDAEERLSRSDQSAAKATGKKHGNPS